MSSGCKSARELKEKYNLTDVLKKHNNNIGDLTNRLLVKLVLLSIKEEKFAVKTHSGPTKFHNLLLALGLIKTIYIYRDPRDVLLSARDHGEKILSSGEDHSFAKLIDFEEALSALARWIDVCKNYRSINRVLCIRYEDLMGHLQHIMDQICKYLNVKLRKDTINEILKKYSPKSPDADMTGLHFNKAIVNRYQLEMEQSEIDRLNSEFGNAIIEMGYEL